MLEPFTQILLLLLTAVAIVLIFRRLGIPSSLGYLLAGLLLGPHVLGNVIEDRQVRVLGDIGIVFLLFTIGLNYSLPQIRALRGLVFGLGTGQVLFTTIVVGIIAWAAGLPAPAAFVIGAVFAQSSTTVISRQLTEQGEDGSRHGRLGLALSVFQDVTAVPFIVVIPVLGTAAGALALAESLGLALSKAVLAFVIVYLAGRWLLRPLFRIVAAQRSAELFTLTVLLVTLAAGATTSSLGLSMAFGAFLAGMMLGDTEFRHQVESTIRPFRDVLLGLFFIGIGMLVDPALVLKIWHIALGAAAVLMVSKTVLVWLMMRYAGMDHHTAWRTGLLLAVGGEFGFALLSIALGADVIDPAIGQIALTAVLFSIILAPVLIRFNDPIASLLSPREPNGDREQAAPIKIESTSDLNNHVILCGFGRIGQNVARSLEEEDIPYIALDLEPGRIREARAAGKPVFYGDASEADILEAAGIMSARLLVIAHENLLAAMKALHHIRRLRPQLPVMVRTRDETHVDMLRAAGASEVIPETSEAGLMIASHVLITLNVPYDRVFGRMQQHWSSRYRSMRELFRTGDPLEQVTAGKSSDRLRSIPLPADSPAIGRRLDMLPLDDAVITALVKRGERRLLPPGDVTLEEGDVLILFGSNDDLERIEKSLVI